MDERRTKLSKALARVLRNRPESAGVVLDEAGWCEISTLLDGMTRLGFEMSRDDLRLVVEGNDKARYAVSADGTRIRAVQGHSVEVRLELRVQRAPSVLFHGTSAKALPDILARGLQPMRRHHVHLSADIDTARSVASRRKGAVALLRVDAGGMQLAGHRFYMSENGVWLVDAVPHKYLVAIQGA